MRLLAVLLAAVAVAGCGGSEPELPAPLDPADVPGLASRERDLGRDELAADAFRPGELGALLEASGYRGGRERELTGHGETFDHVLARTLRFDGAEGAGAYLDWVAGHTLELVGRTRPLPSPGLGDASLLVELEPCTTCKKQLPTLVAAWRDGGAVGYLLASGRGVDREAVLRLAHTIDATLP